jgi:hypothetical protein
MFAHCFYDFRKTGLDSCGIDWFNNTINAIKANRSWCIDHSSEYKSYGPNLWGVNAGSGPNDTYVVLGNTPKGTKDHQEYGVLHPYGAAMALPFVQDDAMNALKEMRKLKIDQKSVWQSEEDGGYGFWDGFDIDKHWISNQVIGIAQGPMLLMVENARTGLIWKLMMKNENIQLGLSRAGFRNFARK